MFSSLCAVISFLTLLNFPHTPQLADWSTHFNDVTAFSKYFDFSKRLFFLVYLLFVSNSGPNPIFPPLGATPTARSSFLQCRSIPLRIPQPGSHRAELCHNTATLPCFVMLRRAVFSAGLSAETAAALLLLTLMLHNQIAPSSRCFTALPGTTKVEPSLRGTKALLRGVGRPATASLHNSKAKFGDNLLDCRSRCCLCIFLSLLLTIQRTGEKE